MTACTRAVVTRQFDVTAEYIFDAWLDPDWIGSWMFGPAMRDERIVRLGVEPRVGGKFSFVVERQGVELEYAGQYLELDRPHLFVCTWGTRNSVSASSRVVVEILPLNHGCELTLTHVTRAGMSVPTNEISPSWRLMLGVLARSFSETKTLILNPT